MCRCSKLLERCQYSYRALKYRHSFLSIENRKPPSVSAWFMWWEKWFDFRSFTLQMYPFIWVVEVLGYCHIPSQVMRCIIYNSIYYIHYGMQYCTCIMWLREGLSFHQINISLVLNLLESFLGEIRNWLLYPEGKKRPKKEARPFQITRWQV